MNYVYGPNDMLSVKSRMQILTLLALLIVGCDGGGDHDAEGASFRELVKNEQSISRILSQYDVQLKQMFTSGEATIWKWSISRDSYDGTVGKTPFDDGLTHDMLFVFRSGELYEAINLSSPRPEYAPQMLVDNHTAVILVTESVRSTGEMPVAVARIIQIGPFDIRDLHQLQFHPIQDSMLTYHLLLEEPISKMALMQVRRPFQGPIKESVVVWESGP